MVRSAAAWERRRAYQRQYRREHPQTDYKAHYRRYALSQRYAMLWKKYGISPERYDCFLLAQHSRCLICNEFMIDAVSRGGRKTGRSVTVDHDHKTGEPRGLLCAKCNTGIGMFGENVEVMQRALDYVKNWERIQCAA